MIFLGGTLYLGPGGGGGGERERGDPRFSRPLYQSLHPGPCIINHSIVSCKEAVLIILWVAWPLGPCPPIPTPIYTRHVNFRVSSTLTTS